jgi:predicted  nucleic acid-binding Zn-ribbon protein
LHKLTDAAHELFALREENERLKKAAYDQADRIHDLEKQLAEYEDARPTD